MFAQSRTISRVAVLSLLLGGLALGQAAHATDTLTLGTGSHKFYISADHITVRPGEVLNDNHIHDQGGDAKGILNGQALVGTYCVGLVDTIYLGYSYNATITNTTGSVFGENINNAGKISWLMKTYAASAVTEDQQNGLQAAIWKTEYGSGFQVDGVENNRDGNTIAMKTAYQNYLSGLGSNTGPVSDVVWISAYTASGQQNGPPAPPTTHYQGLVGLRSSNSSSVPEPGSIALMLGAVLPMIGVIKRRRK